MRSIGEMARDSGLGVSALRFYDGAGVLVPARVDPVTGYRWYGPEQLEESRLLARLRRTGMPLADIRLVLAGWSGRDTDLVRRLLQAHLRRLELGLSDARNEFSTIRALLENRENPMASLHTAPIRLTVSAPELAAALDAVRFAVGSDPELPVLGGVLFDIEGDGLRVVATDRYRMAVAAARTAGHGGPRVQVVVPSPLADAMRALLGDDASAELTVDADRVALETADREVAGRRLDHDFPDYRRLVRLPAGRRALVDVPALREAVETGPVRAGVVREPDGVPCELTVLKVAADGVVTVCEDGDDDRDQVAVNREFLLHALAAGARDRLVLEFGAPTAPLAIRRSDSEDTFSLLMPFRLDD
ncbi:MULTISPECIES: DNA polymerase III subunit beta family protein [unclassified Streptomyces]|uniref:DNA polymerase III subunit beta family protein n=1 Tax=unclassified Streptomyces TaxID=2593676 RepID=UPI002E32D516|nr:MULTISPECIES: MerR family transcriptional regulator [unclassified Streptomyces]WUC65012.1 MerR family transcriptional regulator [Streptomyces sp. NBC_00539]